LCKSRCTEEEQNEEIQASKFHFYLFFATFIFTGDR